MIFNDKNIFSPVLNSLLYPLAPQWKPYGKYLCGHMYSHALNPLLVPQPHISFLNLVSKLQTLSFLRLCCQPFIQLNSCDDLEMVFMPSFLPGVGQHERCFMKFHFRGEFSHFPSDLDRMRLDITELHFQLNLFLKPVSSQQLLGNLHEHPEVHQGGFDSTLGVGRQKKHLN